MKKVAYYKGCLAALSAKELDSSTKALAPKVGLELEELESVTCCGAGDIHEAEPDFYLHLNARILSYAAQTGADTLLTVCNVCTLNLRQANFQLTGDEALRGRVNENLRSVGAPAYNGTIDVRLSSHGDARKRFAGRGLAQFTNLAGLRLDALPVDEEPILTPGRDSHRRAGYGFRTAKGRTDQVDGNQRSRRSCTHSGP